MNKKKPPPFIITSGNYLEHVDGATYVKFGTSMYIYFYAQNVMGIMMGNTMYISDQAPKPGQGIYARRVYDFLISRTLITMRLSQNEIREKAEDIIMLSANQFMNKRLSGE
jgi:hypothetical protein